MTDEQLRALAETLLAVRTVAKSLRHHFQGTDGDRVLAHVEKAERLLGIERPR